MDLLVGTLVLIGAAVLFVKYAKVRALFRGVGVALLIVFGVIGLLLPRDHHDADACPCGRAWPHNHY